MALRHPKKHYHGPGTPDPKDHDPAWVALPLHKRLSLAASAYWNAAQLLYSETRKTPPENLISWLPVIFLFNHAIELYLKELISIKRNNFPNGHNLEDLFRETIATIPGSFENDDFIVFHRMFLAGRFDPKNDLFRYPNTDGYIIHFDEWHVEQHRQIEEWVVRARELALSQLPDDCSWR